MRPIPPRGGRRSGHLLKVGGVEVVLLLLHRSFLLYSQASCFRNDAIVICVGCDCQCDYGSVANMGRAERARDYFRKRLKAERAAKGWSQADLAKMLSDKGIPVHSTTIAKIEAGDREVRIDEAAAMADLFGTSVDALLGRISPGLDSDIAHSVNVLQETAQRAARDLASVIEDVRDFNAELWPLTFAGRDDMLLAGERVTECLADAQDALLKIVKFRLQLDAPLQREDYLDGGP